jgi:hypothetical protein
VKTESLRTAAMQRRQSGANGLVDAARSAASPQILEDDERRSIVANREHGWNP